MYKKVEKYCREKAISIFEFERRCSIGNGTVSRWRNEMSHPSMKTLTKIVNATGMPITYWIGDKDE